MSVTGIFSRTARSVVPHLTRGVSSTQTPIQVFYFRVRSLSRYSILGYAPFPGNLFSGTLPFQVFYSRVRSFSRYSILGYAPYPGILFLGTLPFQVFFSRVRSPSRYSILGNAPCAGILFSGTLSIQVFYSRSLSGNFLEKYTYFQVCIKPFNCKKSIFLEKKNEEIRKNTKN